MQRDINCDHSDKCRDADCQSPGKTGPSQLRSLHHGHSTVILLANIMPKFEPPPLKKFCSPSFWPLAVPSFGRSNCTFHSVRPPPTFTASRSPHLTSLKNSSPNPSRTTR